MKEKAQFATVGIAVLLIGTAWIYGGRVGALKQHTQELKIILIDVKQLEPENAVPPIEIVNTRALSKGNNTIQEFSCTVKNNTSRSITAISLAITTKVINDRGVKTQDTAFLSSDSALHPDVKEERHSNGIQPGASQLMQSPGPSTYPENAFIEGIHIEIAYAEFDDTAALGYDKTGTAAKRIKLKREGASKYKEWLKEQYKQSDASPEAILQKINSSTLPEDLISDTYLKSGADSYRRWLLRVYNNKGTNSVITYINK